MRSLFIAAAALTLGTAAIAQDATQTDTAQQPSGETVDDPSQATGPEGVTQQGTDPNGTAMAPAGTNQAPMAAQPGAMSNMPTQMSAATSYPACSRTITDRCTQSYERGTRRARRR